MNAIRCPQCGTVNQMTTTGCRQCFYSFANLPSTAYVSVSPEELYGAARGSSSGAAPFSSFDISPDNETGRKTFFWYRVYCGVMVALYLLTIALGVFLAVAQPDTREYNSEETLVMGIIYAVVGAIFFLVFAVALFLPRKSYNWIVGIVMMALGLTSCCFVPFLVPLLIYWLKPETKAYFGRK